MQNVGDNDVNAVTWGVFKGKEIIQPTVVDHQAFAIWKDEAFNSFVNTWALIYKAKKNKDGSEEPADQESIDFLTRCYNELWLVNIVDNDYIEGDLNKVIEEFIDENQE